LAAFRFRTIKIIKPIRRITAIDAIIIMIGSQLNPFLGGTVVSVPLPLTASMD
jgi:hypothetical protein